MKQKEEYERKIRANNYKKYVDLQVKLNQDKIEYERQKQKESEKIFNSRNKDLKKLENELMIKDKLYKEGLCNVYKKQMAERKECMPTWCSIEDNNFCGTLDINQRRYFKVI